MPSFDVASKVDLQTLDNAINTVKKEIEFSKSNPAFETFYLFTLQYEIPHFIRRRTAAPGR